MISRSHQVIRAAKTVLSSNPLTTWRVLSPTQLVWDSYPPLALGSQTPLCKLSYPRLENTEFRLPSFSGELPDPGINPSRLCRALLAGFFPVLPENPLAAQVLGKVSRLHSQKPPSFAICALYGTMEFKTLPVKEGMVTTHSQAGVTSMPLQFRSGGRRGFRGVTIPPVLHREN